MLRLTMCVFFIDDNKKESQSSLFAEDAERKPSINPCLTHMQAAIHREVRTRGVATFF